MHYIAADLIDYDTTRALGVESEMSLWLAYELAGVIDGFNELLTRHAAFRAFLDDTE